MVEDGGVERGGKEGGRGEREGMREEGGVCGWRGGGGMQRDNQTSLSSAGRGVKS